MVFLDTDSRGASWCQVNNVSFAPLILSLSFRTTNALKRVDINTKVEMLQFQLGVGFLATNLPFTRNQSRDIIPSRQSGPSSLLRTLFSESNTSFKS